MSDTIPREHLRIGIVCSVYNQEFTDELLNRTVHELQKLSAVATPQVVRVPGAWEIPFALQRLARGNPPPHALIALGVIWQGATTHAQIIATETARACMDISLREDVPVLHQILHISNPEEANQRITGPLNRPAEIASAAHEMARLNRSLR